MMTSLSSRIRKARAAYKNHPSDARLRAYLTLKARANIFDKRMCAYYGCNPKVNAGCRRAICRAYAAGLVPAFTTEGEHAPGSYHKRKNARGEGQAVDIGNRKSLAGTRQGQQRLTTFQRKELWRRRQHRNSCVELIGPDNRMIVLGGQETDLVEGSALETMHDNHVHEAYAG